MTFEDYLTWSRANLGTDWTTDGSRRQYDVNSVSLQNIIQQHSFYAEIMVVLRLAAKAYNTSKPTQLFFGDPAVNLQIKPYASVVSKAYRYNCLNNSRFPREPKDGWYTGSNFYWKVNDLIRACVVCRYADGPSFVAQRIRDHAVSHGLSFECYPMNNDAGYYAYHCYIRIPSFALVEGSVSEGDVSLEIQITTQLQDAMRELTHSLYADDRMQSSNSRDWKWAFNSRKFKTSYLGHTLHLLEGLIVELKSISLSDEDEAADDR
jgi:ppGpp synthetase/RelA/SpoT-type nucleotidyltranferase